MAAIKTEPEEAKSFHHLCRLCLSEELLQDVFTEERLHQWISDYLSITITAEDTMNHGICSVCRIRLAEFHQFRMHCQEVQRALQSMVSPQARNVEQENWTDSKTGIQLQGTENPRHLGNQIQNEVHNKILEGFECAHCGNSFATREKLYNHIDEHEKEDLDIHETKVLDQGKGMQDRLPEVTTDFNIPKQEHAAGNESGQTKFIVHDHFEESKKQENVSLEIDPAESRFGIDTKTDDENAKYQQPMDIEDAIVIEEVKIENRTDDDGVTPSLESDDSSKMVSNREQLDTVPDPEVQKPTVINNDEYLCTKCNSTFSRQCQLKTHMRVHDDIAAEELSTDDGEDQESVNSEDADSDGRPASSATDKSENETKVAKQHQLARRKHRNKTFYVCPICEKPFTDRVHMEDHTRTHLSVEERQRVENPHKCKLCRKTFAQQGTLWKHNKQVHGPKTHECHLCGFKFHMRVDLKKHLQMHNRYGDQENDYHQSLLKQTASNESNDGKGIKCLVCEKPFSNRRHMLVHMRSHLSLEERQREEKPFECDLCRATFGRKDSMLKHKKQVHTPKPHGCDLCGHRFLEAKDLERHSLVVHGGEQANSKSAETNRLKCEICQKSFTRIDYLTNHTKRMHGHTARRCDKCGFKFSRRAHLKNHFPKCNGRSEDISPAPGPTGI